jgi:hypothetical protein
MQSSPARELAYVFLDQEIDHLLYYKTEIAIITKDTTSAFCLEGEKGNRKSEKKTCRIPIL